MKSSAQLIARTTVVGCAVVAAMLMQRRDGHTERTHLSPTRQSAIPAQDANAAAEWPRGSKATVVSLEVDTVSADVVLGEPVGVMVRLHLEAAQHAELANLRRVLPHLIEYTVVRPGGETVLSPPVARGSYDTQPPDGHAVQWVSFLQFVTNPQTGEIEPLFDRTGDYRIVAGVRKAARPNSGGTAQPLASRAAIVTVSPPRSDAAMAQLDALDQGFLLWKALNRYPLEDDELSALGKCSAAGGHGGPYNQLLSFAMATRCHELRMVRQGPRLDAFRRCWTELCQLREGNEAWQAYALEQQWILSYQWDAWWAISGENWRDPALFAERKQDYLRHAAAFLERYPTATCAHELQEEIAAVQRWLRSSGQDVHAR